MTGITFGIEVIAGVFTQEITLVEIVLNPIRIPRSSMRKAIITAAKVPKSNRIVGKYLLFSADNSHGR
jgi:hypothetical protein